MRPPGTYGDVRVALMQAAAAGPAPVRGLAERAGVGFDLAKCTASRMVAAGDLVRLSEGRPSVLGLPTTPLAMPPAGDGLGDLLVAMSTSFWESVR